MAVPLHVFVVFPILFVWKQCFFFQVHWIAVNTVLQKYKPSYIFMWLKIRTKESKHEENSYTKYCYYYSVTNVTPDHRPVFRLQHLVPLVTSEPVLQVKETLH